MLNQLYQLQLAPVPEGQARSASPPEPSGSRISPGVSEAEPLLPDLLLGMESEAEELLVLPI
ncbi:UNVERIFIED_CONTAM: hypothetical protein K2H54_011838, partial [Gekko kuhli]